MPTIPNNTQYYPIILSNIRPNLIIFVNTHSQSVVFLHKLSETCKLFKVMLLKISITFLTMESKAVMKFHSFN